MSIQSEIARLQNAKSAIIAAIEGKGVSVPEGATLDDLAAMVEGIEVSDMNKSVYDTNDSGVVDDAEKLGGQLPEYFAPASSVPVITFGTDDLVAGESELATGTVYFVYE